MKKYLFILLVSVTTLANAKVPGTYILEVNISGRNYRDYLYIQTINHEGKVKGTFEVPNVFKVPFEGMLKNDQLKGEFLASENGNQFKVTLFGDFLDKCSLKGELSNEIGRFATFIGQREGCDE